MKRILVTGGTTFVSKYAAKYFADADYEVYVLNRNSKPQVQGVQLIEGDRHHLGGALKDKYFDVVADITAYNASDIIDLYDSLGSFGQYIMISSSAVYPEYAPQPFREDSEKAANKFWGKYGTDKIEAERALLDRVHDAYILRPPYLYGPMNNVYREAFVFDCAKKDRKFYLPQNGDMKLQFFHVKDLCKLMEVIINNKPEEHILNVGNPESVSIKDWVVKCYACYGKTPEFTYVYDDIEQRNYFSFYNYEYKLDVERQKKIYPETISLDTGLKEAAKWYDEHETEVNRKPYFQFIDTNFANGVRSMYPRSICGTDCCEKCGRKEECGGCTETKGHPLGGTCTAAEYIKREGLGAFSEYKETLVREFNSLGIKDLHVNDLNLLIGFYVNLEYPLPNGQSVKLLEDNKVYLGNQIEIPGSGRCYGIVADEDYLLVCEYGCGGADPQIVVYKRRQARNSVCEELK